MKEQTSVFSETTESQEADQLEVILYEVGDVLFAIDILNVREIIQTSEVAESPNRHPYVDGVVQLRDEWIPVVNLATVLNVKTHEASKENKFMILEESRNKMAFHVQRVTKIWRLRWSDIEAPDELAKGLESNVSGVLRIDGRIAFMLDEEKIMMDIISETVIKQDYRKRFR
ncbi:purine-binding chemotaxis protein CheW [Salicibibacter cibarius]|uniref:Purine-binding chemotaxis protein CheW n=1 Tax=Salicibibacter cibarius TaxID=2743000 RepID=A0A7T7CBQ0_9BACI|nr:chemotaxis protein CheW [Salicibibacter cibarius]QQK76214.1 purine-binding chemotaxis protein CheW [Salicibibacter cibarius]